MHIRTIAIIAISQFQNCAAQKNAACFFIKKPKYTFFDFKFSKAICRALEKGSL